MKRSERTADEHPSGFLQDEALLAAGLHPIEQEGFDKGVQITIQDPLSGLVVSTRIPVADSLFPPGGYGVIYSSDAGNNWIARSGSCDRSSSTPGEKRPTSS